MGIVAIRANVAIVRGPHELTNQMGYITLIVQLSGIYGYVNKPPPRAIALRFGSFTAINP